MGLGKFRLETNGVAISDDRLVDQSAKTQSDAQIVMGLRIIGFEPDGGAISSDGFVGKPFVPQRIAQIVVIMGDVRIDRDRSLDQIDAGVQSPGLVGDHAEQVQRIGMIRLLIQHPAIDFLGLGKSSRPMVLDGQLHRLIDRELSHPRFPAFLGRLKYNGIRCECD